jgi:hypothetical protein
MLINMNDKREFDAADIAEMRRKWQNYKIPGRTSMKIPLNIIRVRIDNIGLADIVSLTVNFDDDFNIGLNTVVHIKINFSPTNEKLVFKVIDA